MADSTPQRPWEPLRVIDLDLRVTDELDHSYLVQEVWRDDANGSWSFLVIGGPKAYLRKFDTGAVEWGWVVNDAARRLLPPEEVSS